MEIILSGGGYISAVNIGWIYLNEHQLLKAPTLSLLISQTRESDIFTIHLISLVGF